MKKTNFDRFLEEHKGPVICRSLCAGRRSVGCSVAAYGAASAGWAFTEGTRRAKRLIKQAFEGGTPRAGEWTEEGVLAAIEERRGGEATAASRLIDWSKQKASRINWGKGENDGSFCPVFDLSSGYPFIPVRLYRYGRVEILFNRMAVRQNAPFDQDEKRLELLRRLNELPGINLTGEVITRRPAIDLALLVDANTSRYFLTAIEWAVAEVRGRQSG